jgi:hypothetical protein
LSSSNVYKYSQSVRVLCQLHASINMKSNMFMVFNYFDFQIVHSFCEIDKILYLSISHLGLSYHKLEILKIKVLQFFFQTSMCCVANITHFHLQFHCAECYSLLLTGSISIPLVQTYCTCLTANSIQVQKICQLKF